MEKAYFQVPFSMKNVGCQSLTNENHFIVSSHALDIDQSGERTCGHLSDHKGILHVHHL